MAQSPEELKRDIEQTRRELSYDVDALNEKVSPSRIVSRRVDKTRGAVAGLKDRVMGTASHHTSVLSDKAGSATSSIGDRAGSASSGMSSAASSVG